ncbi:MAG: methylamine utilization protein MauG [Amphritea sp.]|nr:methylamine utilization protein MauG [Amphritea sp.]
MTGCSTDQTAPAKTSLSKAELGQALYFDTNLSANRTQSCATCHAPEAGFADPRDNGVKGAVSLGDDGKSLGDRHAPSAAYAMFSPDFQLGKNGIYKGGQFHDGRENDLAGQAGGPPTNPIEMGLTSKAMAVTRLQENPIYVDNFTTLYGSDIFADSDKAYAAMADSIASFERTELFAPFDSKYDRFLKGEAELTTEEELGRTLFFSQQFTNCNLCHQLKPNPGAEQETFSNYEYRNIGVPVNKAVRAVNGVAADHIDHGLLDNPAVNDPNQDGKFKTPTLRNVAITGPYMHNGVFQDLRTVVLFYNKYNSRSAKRQINPETGEQWAAPEVPQTLDMKELETGPALNDQRIDALVAFMKTLTDKRYEHMLR